MAMTRTQLRHAAAVARYQAGKNKPPTRKQAKAWLAPIRKALAEIMTGEVDTHRGYPITRIHWADNDVARIDHAINGFVALIERLMPDLDSSPMKRMSKKLEAGALLELHEVTACQSLIDSVEDLLLKFKRSDLVDAANTEMVVIELERLGLKEAA